jgi:hypothetical protein
LKCAIAVFKVEENVCFHKATTHGVAHFLQRWRCKSQLKDWLNLFHSSWPKMDGCLRGILTICCFVSLAKGNNG